MTTPTIGSANIHPLSEAFHAYVGNIRHEIVQDVLRALKHPSRLEAEAHDKWAINTKLAGAGWPAMEAEKPSFTIVDDKAVISADPIIIPEHISTSLLRIALEVPEGSALRDSILDAARFASGSSRTDQQPKMDPAIGDKLSALLRAELQRGLDDLGNTNGFLISRLQEAIDVCRRG